jgi:hypothetical protein
VAAFTHAASGTDSLLTQTRDDVVQLREQLVTMRAEVGALAARSALHEQAPAAYGWLNRKPHSPSRANTDAGDDIESVDPDWENGQKTSAELEIERLATVWGRCRCLPPPAPDALQQTNARTQAELQRCMAELAAVRAEMRTLRAASPRPREPEQDPVRDRASRLYAILRPLVLQDIRAEIAAALAGPEGVVHGLDRRDTALDAVEQRVAALMHAQALQFEAMVRVRFFFCWIMVDHECRSIRRCALPLCWLHHHRSSSSRTDQRTTTPTTMPTSKPCAQPWPGCRKSSPKRPPPTV